MLGSTPARLTGKMCARITIAEIEKPLRFCNRYVSTAAGQGDDGSTSTRCSPASSSDLGGALATIDAYTGKPPRVTGVNVLLRVHRGADQAFIRSVRLPARARQVSGCARGSSSSSCAAAGSPARTRSGFPATRAPAPGASGSSGQDADQGEDGFTTIILGEEDERDEGGDPGPATLAELAAQVRGTQRYDGVSVRIGRARGNAFRDDDFRISGQAETIDPDRRAESKR